jgi:hypothetical protein
MLTIQHSRLLNPVESLKDAASVNHPVRGGFPPWSFRRHRRSVSAFVVPGSQGRGLRSPHAFGRVELVCMCVCVCVVTVIVTRVHNSGSVRARVSSSSDAKRSCVLCQRCVDVRVRCRTGPDLIAITLALYPLMYLSPRLAPGAGRKT